MLGQAAYPTQNGALQEAMAMQRQAQAILASSKEPPCLVQGATLGERLGKTAEVLRFMNDRANSVRRALGPVPPLDVNCPPMNPGLLGLVEHIDTLVAELAGHLGDIARCVGEA